MRESKTYKKLITKETNMQIIRKYEIIDATN